VNSNRCAGNSPLSRETIRIEHNCHCSPHPRRQPCTMASSKHAARRASSLVSTSSGGYICRSCRNQLSRNESQQIRQVSTRVTRLHPSQTAAIQRRHASLLPFGRRQQPPSPPVEEIPPYEEASTWDGLEHMGHDNHWTDIPARPEDEYIG
jgi:hypothetical protein